jgi:hypothetical protein
MSQKFLTNIDLNKNELQNAKIQNLGTAPSSPADGQVYFDTVDNALKIYDGTSWVNLHEGDISGVTAGTGLSGGGSSGAVTISLANTAVTAGSFGSATAIPTFTVDAQGRLTSVSTAAISTNLGFTDDNTTSASVALNGGTLSILGGTGVSTTANDASDSLTVAIGQDVGTTADVTFNSVTASLTGAVTGNADTATALETARTIGGVSFDGTANISLPGVDTAGNQNTSGNAATATALATARTIALSGDVTATGVSFDGTGNITLTTAMANDSVDLGTHTTGDYVQNLVAGTGVSVSVVSGEGQTPTVAIGQAVGTSDNVTFNDLIVSGDLTVNGTTSTVNSTTITVDDKNIELGSVASPNDTTADGGGITLKGATDKTFNWVNSSSAWTASEHIDLASAKEFLINGTSVLSATALGTAVAVSLLSASASSSEGRIAWDSTNDKIVVGDGSTQREFASSTLKTNAEIASYTLVLGDKDKLVEMGVGSANTLTVPPNSSVAYAVGTQITVLQTGAGQTTLTAGAGVTINGTPGLKLRDQWSSATLIKRATDTWVAMGDLSD